ncbi:Uncharacterised protein [Mycobacteroides abscessus subsp. abscessus]|nr:Uncharacterised protein [Mycobacteroides abscessus subsp. abscessus]
MFSRITAAPILHAVDVHPPLFPGLIRTCSACLVITEDSSRS